jgi:hypothetical protein
VFVLLLIPLAAVVLVVLAVVGFAGFGPLTDDRRADRSGVIGAIGPAVGLLLGSVVLAGAVIAGVGLVGVDGGADGDDGGRRGGAMRATSPTSRPVESAPTARQDATTVTTQPAAGGGRPAVALGPVVAIEAGAATFPASYDVADGLGPATVLRMRATGFEPFVRGVAQQCVDGSPTRCGNSLPVQFDEDGAAEFQYLVSDDFLAPLQVPGRCRADSAPCTVNVRALSGRDHGEIHTVFGDRVAPAGRISVTPSRELSLDGQTVTVTVDDYPPGARLDAMLCAAPDATGTRCGTPGPTAPLVVGANGTGRARLVIEPSRVGTEGAPCFRGDDCGVSVASAAVFARAPVVRISFAAPPGAAYDPTRLVIGLGLAIVLLVIAAVLLRHTDWSPIGEAAAPEIDDAEYADLDAIIAALPPIEDEPVPVH